jgi:hypothetical protein
MLYEALHGIESINRHFSGIVQGKAIKAAEKGASLTVFLSFPLVGNLSAEGSRSSRDDSRGDTIPSANQPHAPFFSKTIL